MNTTFEKEDDEEEQSVPAPPPPFKNEAEDEDASATAAVESEDKFLTPAEEKPVEESLPAGNTMEDTLKVISALFQDVSDLVLPFLCDMKLTFIFAACLSERQDRILDRSDGREIPRGSLARPLLGS